jgi:hypothetical protein
MKLGERFMLSAKRSCGRALRCLNPISRRVARECQLPPIFHSFQNDLNLSGAISVYRTVCAMFLWPK